MVNFMLCVFYHNLKFFKCQKMHMNIHSSFVWNSQKLEKNYIYYNDEWWNKRKKLLMHSTTWMDINGIMLSEKSQSL